jgi:hypothetical protein
MKLLTSQVHGTAAPSTNGDGKEADVLYYASDASLLWFVSNQGPEWNFVDIQSDDDDQDSFVERATEGSARCGNFCYQKILPEHRARMDKCARQIRQAAQKPKLLPPSSADLQTVVIDTKYHDILPVIARFASLHKKDDAELTTFLRNTSWRDVVQDQDRMIERDAELFKELESRLEETRVEILIGGRNSGRSRFVNQFISFRGPTAVKADFSPQDCADIRNIFEAPSTRYPEFNLDAQAIFGSLAFSAYKNLREHLGTDASKIISFLDLQGSIKTDDFAYAYFNKARRIPPIELLLQTVDKLAKLSSIGGVPHKILIFLPFRRLNEYFWDKNEKDQPDRREERRGVWKALDKFAIDNLDHLGRPRENSVLSQVHNASLLLELRRIDLPLLPDSFCKACIIQIPPLTDNEIKHLWKKRTSTEISRDILRVLKTLTGGHPYLIDTLVTVASLQGAKVADEKAQLTALTNAAGQLRNALPKTGNPANNVVLPAEIHHLLKHFANYVELLSDELPQSTLSNDGPLFQLQSRYKEIRPTSELSDWLASGFAPLEAPDDAPMSGFANYPDITSSAFPALVDDIVRELKSPSRL